MARSSEFNSYRELIKSFSQKELYLIARIKRFMECVDGDSAFRTTLETDPNDPEVLARLQKIGVDFQPDDLMPLWKQPEGFSRYYQWLISPSSTPEEEPDIGIALERWPLVELWIHWLQASTQLFNKEYSAIPNESGSPYFKNWHRRRVASAKSELGSFGSRIDHPILAFELSSGCSIGCWFCGFSAEKLSEVFSYTPENRSLWRDIVKAGWELFGPASGWALCYYATEPYDNPNYLDFLKDYRDITGYALCTATAAPMKSPEWLRSLIGFYREGDGPHSWPRLSVLSVGILRRIHETYTPDELRDVNLLIQTKKSPHMKAVSGRLLHGQKEELGAQQIPDEAPFIPQGSIACVSGFLVNMVERTIKLVSPCYASERWPKGYRVFAETTFDTALDYRQALEGLLEHHMPQQVTPEMTLGFRDDLICTTHEHGFSLRSPHHKHHVQGKAFHPQLGQLLTQGTKTYREIIDELTAQKNASVFDVSRIVMKLFDRGLLNEICPSLEGALNK